MTVTEPEYGRLDRILARVHEAGWVASRRRCPPHPGQGAGRTGGAVTDRCCDDIAVHSHDGGRTMRRNGLPHTWRAEFQWRRPRLTWYRTADRYRFKPALNRYPGIVIGAQIVIGHRALGVLWGKPGRIVYLPTAAP